MALMLGRTCQRVFSRLFDTTHRGINIYVLKCGVGLVGFSKSIKTACYVWLTNWTYKNIINL